MGTLELAMLVGAAFVAGTIDAIAGGGGLITLPTFLALGVPPHVALATNKAQSVFGAFSALFRYARSGLIDVKRSRLSFPLGFAGSLIGALLVLRIRPEPL